MDTKRKNILFIHHTSDLYGASRVFLDTVTIAKQANHQPFVVLSSTGPLTEELRKLHIPVMEMDLGVLRRKYMNLPGLLNRVLEIIVASYKIGKLIKRHQIDLVYSNSSGILAGAIASKFTKRHHLCHLHEVIPEASLVGKVLSKFMRITSDKIIAVSYATQQAWKAHDFKLSIEVIHNGFHYERFLSGQSNVRQELDLSDDQLVIGMVARVHFWKGQSYFLDIARELLNAGLPAKFLMVGDVYPGYEHLYAQVKDQIHRLLLQEEVFNLGYRRDIPEVLQTLDLLISPSTGPDPLPTILLESMASGLPTAATAHGGSREIVNEGKTGILIPVNDAQKATEKLLDLLHNPELMKQMGINGRKRVVDHFSFQAYQENMLNTFAKF